MNTHLKYQLYFYWWCDHQQWIQHISPLGGL